MPALDRLDLVSSWLACTPHNPYVDVQAEDAQSTFTYYSSDDSSVGGGKEFEAAESSEEEPPEKIQRVENWDLHSALDVETDSADTASWSGEESEAVFKDPSYFP